MSNSESSSPSTRQLRPSSAEILGPPSCLCQELAGPGAELAPECLAHLWMFERLNRGEVEALLAAAWRARYQTGEEIFHQDTPADAMFLVKAGRLKLTKATEDGRELILDIRKAGDVIGEAMLSEESEYPVSALCVEDTLVCGFTRTRFERLVEQFPAIGYQVIRNLSSRVTWLVSRVDSMSESRLEDRLYRVLVTVAREHGHETEAGLAIQFPLTHEELAFLTGSHRVTVTRTMKTLRESGRVVQEKGRLVLPKSA